MLRWAQHSRGFLAAAVIGGVFGPLPAPAPVAAFPGPTVDIVGHGFGHGRGMGQFGALGYALKGWSHTRILDHYYGGTKMGTLTDPVITVNLTAFDGLDVLVHQEQGHMTTSAAPGLFRSLRAQRVGDNLFNVQFAQDCGGGPTGWQPVPGAQGVPGPIGFAPTKPAEVAAGDHTEMIQGCEPTGTFRWVRGEMLAVDDEGTPRAVNRLDMEGYLKGVVPRESPAFWGTYGGGSGLEALKAQAVAARSYAAAENRRPGIAKTCDTVACQVYEGHAKQDAMGFRQLEEPSTDKAVDETAGEVRIMTSTGKVARTEFSSSTGGYSAGGTFPAVVDEGDATTYNPSRVWKAKVPVALIEEAHPEVGALLSVDITERNGLGSLGGRVTELVLRGTGGRATLSGEELRFIYPYSSRDRPDGMRSNWFRVVNNPSGGLSGYWVAGPDGGVFAFGEAAYAGSTGGMKLNRPILDMAATRSGEGYWLVASDGGVFAFGDAGFFGSMGGVALNKPVVGMAATPSGKGYWLLASDGGVFAFGDAGFLGSMGGVALNKPVVGMAATSSGEGYWLVASDGGVFAFGDAAFYGSTGATRLNRPMIGMAGREGGYWLVASDGGVFAYGDAGFHGSLPDTGVAGPARAMRATRTGDGYLLVTDAGQVVHFGDAPVLGDVAEAVPGYDGGVAGFAVKASRSKT